MHVPRHTRQALPASLLVSLLLAAPVFAQPGGSGATDGSARLHAGVALAVAQPRGEFSDYVNVGGGIHGFLRVGMDEAGLLSLRIQGGFLNYGNETKRVCLSPTVGCRIEVDLSTSNNIFLLGLGPELGVPVGSGRLYANTTVGLGYFSTDSNIAGVGQGDQHFSTQNYGDGGLSWNAGGGAEMLLGRIQRLPVSLDFGLSYQGNGRREYLTRGDIIDREDGSIELDVKRSEADFLIWRLGISIGIIPEVLGGP